MRKRWAHKQRPLISSYRRYNNTDGMKRLTRAEQAQRNRGLVLDAARRVFLACGYHSATLEQIADEAGFSKGVVYSQFDSKADLFLALLEARIEERAADNAKVAQSLTNSGDLKPLLKHLVRGDQAPPGWLLLLIEFRVHAARDPELSRRYAAAHARTIDRFAEVLDTVAATNGREPAVSLRQLAELALALSTGTTLEQAANPDALGGPELATQLAQVLEPLVRPAAAPATPTALQTRVSAELSERLGAYTGRLSWDADQLATHQQQRLRTLLSHAAEHSPFHRRRLGGLDPSHFQLSDLTRLPVMTKSQMMDSFDDVITDPRLNRRLVEEHLAACQREPGLLFDRYVCLASGGSSGQRGIFVQTLGEYLDFVASLVRPGYAKALAAGGPPPDGLVLGIVAAASPVHSSGFGAAVAVRPPVQLIPAPATLPLAEIVARLNTAQPPALQGYPSKLAELAREQLAGRLHIAPCSVMTVAELLTDTDRALIEHAFATPVINAFVSTEGLVGHSQPGGSVLSFASDMCLAELVDDDNKPAPPGVLSTKVLVTNLHNLTQPLVRYELTDRFTSQTSAPAGWLRASVEGRADDIFHYASVAVHPHVIRSALVSQAAVREYQVRQTERGVDVACVADGDFDHRALAARLEHALCQAGLAEPQVIIKTVPAISRHPDTGKLKRFIPTARTRSV